MNTYKGEIVLSKKECKDHLGNVYASETDMCKFYNITKGAYKGRIKRGWSLEESLTTPTTNMSSSITDHQGNIFSSHKDMCIFYGIDYELFQSRLKRGMSIKEILSTPKKINPANSHECYDYLGNKYSSIKEMCEHYNVSPSTYRSRINYGYSLKEALTGQRIFDHLGNGYLDVKSMCDAYGLKRSTYESRISKGWSLEKALTFKIKEKSKRIYSDKDNKYFESIHAAALFYNYPSESVLRKSLSNGLSLDEALTISPKKSRLDADIYVDNKDKKAKVIIYKGKEYSSLKKLAIEYKVPYMTLHSRLRRGISLEDAMSRDFISSRKKVIDFDGNIFPSESAMCRHYNISTSLYRQRLKIGWNLKDALLKPVRDDSCYDHLGNKFKNTDEMCEYYHINSNTFFSRKSYGYSLKDCLTMKLRDFSCYDHLGNKYTSQASMCKHYNIDYKAFIARIAYGYTLEEALTKPMYSYECSDHLGNIYNSFTELSEAWNISYGMLIARLQRNWTIEEALTIPRNMYIGEYRVAECLKKLDVKFYHDCQIKTIFKDFNIGIDWDIFLDSLQRSLSIAGMNWSKKKIEKLRPDFVLYTDNDNKIRGVIEFDGEQHQNFVEYFFKTIEEFYRRSDADFVKQSLWEYLNIPMLRIRHDQVDMIDDMVKDFIDNPQNYIHNHNTYLSEDEYWSILSEEKAKLELAFAS